MRRQGSRHTVGLTLFVAGLLVLAASCSSSGNGQKPSGTVSSPTSRDTSSALTVTSTLDGRQTVPHRIHWEARPSLPGDEVSEVDFLVDGEMAWVEHNTPYFYGDDGGYLVTTFLTPGEHSFTIRVITVGGQSAESTVKATVAAPPAPPSDLAGTPWSRTMTASDQNKASSSEAPPTGRWELTIDSVGWLFHDPQGGGQLWDVAYRSPGRVELRTTIEQPPYPSPTGGSICEEPDRSALWTYTIGNGGKTLTLHPVAHDPCGDRLAILEGTWASKGA